MKKHVRFIENNCGPTGLYNKTPFLPRSSELRDVAADKTNPRFASKTRTPTTQQVKEQNQDIKTIQIPMTMTAAPFLQHAGLTPGQKRFLYSIAEAYSKEHMRQLIHQHYMNVLHRSIRTDLNVNVKQPKSLYTSDVEHITNNPTKMISNTKDIGKRNMTGEKVKKTTLPKINNHQRITSMGY